MRIDLYVGMVVTSPYVYGADGSREMGFIKKIITSIRPEKYAQRVEVEFPDRVIEMDACMVESSGAIGKHQEDLVNKIRGDVNLIKEFKSFAVVDVREDGDYDPLEDLDQEEVVDAVFEVVEQGLEFGQVYEHKKDGTRIFILHPSVDVFGSLRDAMPDGDIFVYRNLATKTLGARSVRKWHRFESQSWTQAELTENERAAPF